jgi:hypothetical protein
LTKALRHLRSNAVAYLALFVALGGTGYAAVKLPAGSVGNRQIMNHAVTPIKFDKGAIAGYVRAYARLSAHGAITAARPAAKVIVWRTSFEPGGLIQWDQPIPSSCFAVATTQVENGSASAASAQLASGGAKHDGQALIALSVAGQPVNVAVICPQP